MLRIFKDSLDIIIVTAVYADGTKCGGVIVQNDPQHIGDKKAYESHLFNGWVWDEISSWPEITFADTRGAGKIFDAQERAAIAASGHSEERIAYFLKEAERIDIAIRQVAGILLDLKGVCWPILATIDTNTISRDGATFALVPLGDAIAVKTVFGALMNTLPLVLGDEVPATVQDTDQS